MNDDTAQYRAMGSGFPALYHYDSIRPVEVAMRFACDYFVKGSRINNMIKNEAAYQKALDKLKQDKDYIVKEKLRFKEMGLNDEQVDMAIEPLLSFHEQLKEEVEYYERIKRGAFNPIHKFTDIGKSLIAYRIS